MILNVALGWLIEAVDLLVAVLGLLLVLRVLFVAFGMRSTHPLMRITTALTDPLIDLSNKALGIPAYGSTYRTYRSSRTDILNCAVALIALWVVRSLISWLLRLIMLIPLWIAQPLGSIGAVLQFVLGLIFDLYVIALFVRVLFSWIRTMGGASAPYASKVMRFLWSITEPVLAPIRRALSSLGPSVFGLGLDLSPLIAFLLVRLVQQIVFSLLARLF
jgi:YggT family protein